MLRMLALAALSLVGACGKDPPRDPARPDSYARQWAVMPGEGAAEQQFALPGDALVALKSADLADVRLFDASGRALPLARFDQPDRQTELVSLPSWPVMGRDRPGEAGVALTIGPDKVARVVGIAGPDGVERQVALLIDTRGTELPAVAVRVSADLPLRQLVTLRASVSSDLTTWEPLGEKSVFRTDAAGNQLDNAQIGLNGAVLKDRYLQVTWDRDDGVTVTGAQLILGRNPPASVETVTTAGARLEKPHELRFKLHQPYPADVLQIVLRGNEGVLPVQLHSRRSAEEPWQQLTAATLRAGQASGLTMTGASGPEFRLVADERTPGFAAVPKLALQFDEVTLLTRFSGKPPYHLAVGLDRAPRALLAPGDIVPRGRIQDLPRARVSAGATPLVDLSPGAGGGTISGRKAALWLSLLAGVAVLAFAVLRLVRNAPPPAD